MDIEERYNVVIHSIIRTIDGVKLSGDTAEELKVRESSAGLNVARAYSDLSNRMVEIEVNFYPVANLSYRMEVPRNLDATHR